MDMSDQINEDLIVQWTGVVLKQVETYHRFFKDQDDGVPPFICHVFNKCDLLLNAVREQNIHKLREM